MGLKLYKKIVKYLRKLIETDSIESSKRFMSLSTMILIFYGVLRFTNSENLEYVLAELLGFILVLCGVAVWEKIGRK
tara:strand:+ start:203 stop:433 length:231 start_codon:yes stop_codon:yes gene_type:complete